MKSGGSAVELARSMAIEAPDWTPDAVTKAVVVEKDTELSPKDGDTLLVLVKADATVREEGSGEYDVVIVCAPNTNCKYYSISDASRVDRTAYVRDDATVDWVDVALSGAKSHVTSYLIGTGSHAEFQSIFLGVKDERYDIKSRMIHLASNSTSNMRTRSVMLDESHGTYEGLIRIDESASGCDAYQKEDSLLLSPDASMDATPNLEISNEDVRCSHGVSLSQLDDEKIFYFRSRGIPEDRAVDLIVHGFFDEILDLMGSHAETARTRLFTRLEARI